MSTALVFRADDDELAVFLAETDELLQALDNAAVTLEREPANRELLQEIFRIAHTIKGSSASIGHTPMAELTHTLENLLDQLRSGRLSATSDIVDLLLQSLDALRVLADEVRTRTASGADFGDLRQRLAEAAAGESAPRPAPVAAMPARSGGATTGPLAQGMTLVRVYVGLSEAAQLPAVRLLQALIALEELGHVVWSEPTREQVEQENVGRALAALVATPDDPEQVRSILLQVDDVETVATAVEEPEAQPAAAPAPAAAPGPRGAGQPAVDPVDAAGQRMAKMAKTVRIDVSLLDTLMNLVGELVIDRTRLQNIAARTESLAGGEGLFEGLAATARHLERITSDLQVEIMKSRMLPVDHVFSRFPRLVRDLARRFEKEVELVIEGADTELDRSVIEEIGDPLMHLLRNAIDHGVEKPEVRESAGKPRVGTVRLSARHESGQIVIEVADDGRGIDGRRIRQAALEKGLLTSETAERLDDQDAVDLIFLAGLSTAKEVSDVSGRGVGMDVVRTNVEKLNGSITITTALGQGTTFAIRLPLTLAIVRALLVAARGGIYALPLSTVVETLRIERNALRWVNHRLVVDVRGAAMPLVPLSALLWQRGPAVTQAISNLQPNGHRLLAVAVQHGTRQVGLLVDHLIGEQEIVIKPLDPLIGEIEGVAGTAILGDGRIAPILYVPGLMKDLVQSGMVESATRLAV